METTTKQVPSNEIDKEFQQPFITVNTQSNTMQKPSECD